MFRFTPVSDPLDVLIAEDRQLTAQRLALALEGNARFRVCAIAPNLQISLELFERHKPRALLVDLGLPDGSGISLIRAAEAAHWPCDSLVVSVFGDESRVVEAIRAGAKGYILKSDRLPDIARSLGEVVDGGSPISPQIARHLLTLVQSDERQPDDAPEVKLTPREREILSLIAKGYRRQEVADRFDISIGTVGTHINNIYRKLEVGSNTAAIAAAGRLGLV